MLSVFGVSFAAVELSKDWSVTSGSALVSSKGDGSNPLGIQGVLREIKNPRFTRYTVVADLVGIDQFLLAVSEDVLEDFRVQKFLLNSSGVTFFGPLGDRLFYRFPTEDAQEGSLDFTTAAEGNTFRLPVTKLLAAYSRTVQQTLSTRLVTTLASSTLIKFASNFSAAQRSLFTLNGNGIAFVGRTLYSPGVKAGASANVSAAVTLSTGVSPLKFSVGLWCLAGNVTNGVQFFSWQSNTGAWNSSYMLALRLDLNGAGVFGLLATSNSRTTIHNTPLVPFSRQTWHRVIMEANANADGNFCVQVDGGTRSCVAWPSNTIGDHTALFFLTGARPLDGRVGAFVAVSGDNATSVVSSYLNDNVPSESNSDCKYFSESFGRGSRENYSAVLSGQADFQSDSLHIMNASINSAFSFASATGFTATLWVRFDSLVSAGNVPIFSMLSGISSPSISSGSLAVLFNAATGKFVSTFSNSNGTVSTLPEVAASSIPISAMKWYFVAVSAGDRGICLTTQFDSSCLSWDGTFKASNVLQFGNIGGVTAATAFFGSVDELQLFQCQLSSFDLASLMSTPPPTFSYAEDFTQSPWSSSLLTLYPNASCDGGTLLMNNGYARLPFPLSNSIFPLSGDIFVGFWIFPFSSGQINQAVLNMYNASSANDGPAGSYSTRVVEIYREPNSVWSRTMMASGYVSDTAQISISPDAWYKVVVAYLRSKSQICMTVTPLSGNSTTRCTNWNGSIKPFNSLALGRYAQFSGRYAAFAISTASLEDTVSPWLDLHLPPVIPALSGGTPSAGGPCQTFAWGKYCTYSTADFLPALSMTSSSSIGGDSNATGADWLQFDAIKAYFDDVAGNSPSIFVTLAYLPDPTPSPNISSVITAFSSYYFDDVVACAAYPTGIRPGITFVAQISFPCNGSSAFCALGNYVLSPLKGATFDVYFHTGWDYSISGFPTVGLSAQVALRLSSQSSPMDFLVFSVREAVLWLDATVASPTISNKELKEETFVGFAVNDLRLGFPLFGLEDVAFSGCWSYGFGIKLGKKVSAPKFSVGGVVKMIGDWYPTFVSHNRFRISNISLAATAKIVDVPPTPPYLSDFAGTFNGSFAFCHRDFETCVTGFSESFLALKKYQVQINMSFANVLIGDLITVFTDCRDLAMFLPKDFRNVGIKAASVYLVPAPAAVNGTGFLNVGYIAGLRISIPFPGFLSGGTQGNTADLSMDAGALLHCETIGSGSGGQCLMNVSLGFSAGLDQPLDLGVSGASVKLSSKSDPKKGPFWSGQGSASYQVTVSSNGIANYGLSNISFSTSFESLLQAAVFGFGFNAYATMNLFAVPGDDDGIIAGTIPSLEVHMTGQVGICVSLDSFVAFSLDALIVRVADTDLSAGAKFTENPTEIVAVVKASTTADVSAKFLSKLGCKVWAKLKAAIQKTCQFTTNLIADLNLPLKTYDGLASCTCPSGSTYVAAGVCAPNPGKPYPCPCHKADYTRVDANSCFLSNPKAPKFPSYSKRCVKRTKVFGKRICILYNVDASCPSGYTNVGALCVDSRSPYIWDDANCECKTGTTGPDSVTGWCVPSLDTKLATCSCSQGNAVLGLCFKDVATAPLQCPTDVTGSSLKSLRSTFSSLARSTGGFCQELCKVPGVTQTIRSLTKAFCDSNGLDCAFDCLTESCDTCSQVCQTLVSATSGVIVNVIDFLQNLQGTCSDDPSYPQSEIIGTMSEYC